MLNTGQLNKIIPEIHKHLITSTWMTLSLLQVSWAKKAQSLNEILESWDSVDTESLTLGDSHFFANAIIRSSAFHVLGTPLYTVVWESLDLMTYRPDTDSHLAPRTVSTVSELKYAMSMIYQLIFVNLANYINETVCLWITQYIYPAPCAWGIAGYFTHVDTILFS